MRARIGLIMAVLAGSGEAGAVTSSASVPSNMGGNGHNISFDGRLFIVRTGPGWEARLLRPEAVTYRPDGLPDAQGPMISPSALILTAPDPSTLMENALAICEEDATRAPYSCDGAGAPSAGGPFDCYDLWIIDSDAVTPPDMGGFVLRRRHLTVWVANPKTAGAVIDHWAWGPIAPLAPLHMGIEPTVTSDGKLMVWQGHPDNDGKIDILMYALNDTPCGLSGWSTPHVITHMPFDPAVIGRYRLGERTLRAADGTPFSDGQLFRGAYPWLMPSGDAVIFDAAPMPCRAMEDPPGCGPRRNATSIIGYPTNWGLAHIDGGINPDTNQTVRLFFSSPGASTFDELPVSEGLDVWPMFGSNTSNYVEIRFDDGLDGNYGGFWHFNESVNVDGEMDTTRTPDVSGYFNTGLLRGGLGYSLTNDGVVGKALSFDGVDDRVEVPHATSLNPVNGITIDFWIRPGADPNCDANNNWRQLIGKGNIGDGSYTIVFEENRALHMRVFVAGVQQEIWTPPVAASAWTHVSCEYDGPSGKAGCWFNDANVAMVDLAPGTIEQGTQPLLIGAPGARAACPDGDGAFNGMLDEVSISRVARRIGTPPPPDPDAGVPPPPDPDAGGPGPGEPDAGGPGANGGTSGGCGCQAGGAPGGALTALLAMAQMAAWRRRRRRS